MKKRIVNQSNQPRTKRAFQTSSSFNFTYTPYDEDRPDWMNKNDWEPRNNDKKNKKIKNFISVLKKFF